MLSGNGIGGTCWLAMIALQLQEFQEHGLTFSILTRTAGDKKTSRLVDGG